MKKIGRRLFSRAAVGVPTALKMGVDTRFSPPSVGMPGLLGTAQSMAGATGAQIAKQAAQERAWKAIRVEHKAEREHEEIRYQRRQMMGGLDPDLAVLNSMSLALRVQIQIEREKAIRDRGNTLSARIMRRFGLDPEEFL